MQPEEFSFLFRNFWNAKVGKFLWNMDFLYLGCERDIAALFINSKEKVVIV